ncbi:MAG: response regulator transcription factor [Anaerolineae bacterium]|nr:response regulator transcription factor [Anaerolineae bacterium]
MNDIRVVLADDYPLIRESVRNLLEKAEGITVIGEAADGHEALKLVSALEPEVLVLDMEMPGLSGVKVAQQLQLEQSPVRVLVISAYDDKQYIQGMLKTGAAGYLVKSEVTPDMIINAIRGVAGGEKNWVSPRIFHQIFESSSATSPKVLNHQEKEILRLVIAGKTDREISSSLNLSEERVQQHLDAIFNKLDVVSRVKAALRAVREGLV